MFSLLTGHLEGEADQPCSGIRRIFSNPLHQGLCPLEFMIENHDGTVEFLVFLWPDIDDEGKPPPR
jgi:hypothetical protein